MSTFSRQAHRCHYEAQHGALAAVLWIIHIRHHSGFVRLETAAVREVGRLSHAIIVIT
jgi:hypothetical protein